MSKAPLLEVVSEPSWAETSEIRLIPRLFQELVWHAGAKRQRIGAGDSGFDQYAPPLNPADSNALADSKQGRLGTLVTSYSLSGRSIPVVGTNRMRW